MRKRSKYRPKPQYANPLDAVLERIAPVTANTDAMLRQSIKNHGALTALMRGEATKVDLELLIAMSNMSEMLLRMGFGRDYTDVVATGNTTVLTVARRFEANGRVTLYAQEIAALNLLMELHDAQMEVITMRDMEDAIKNIKKELAAGRFEAVRKKKEIA